MDDGNSPLSRAAPQGMTAKQQFDACMKLADFGAARWDARRQYEWRLSLGVWALLAAAIGTLRVETLPVWVGILALSLYFWWLLNLWQRNKWERRLMWNFVFEAQRICLKYDIKGVEREEPLGAQSFIRDWSAQFQFGATFLLIVLVYLVCAKQITWFKLVV